MPVEVKCTARYSKKCEKKFLSYARFPNKGPKRRVCETCKREYRNIAQLKKYRERQSKYYPTS